MGIEFANVVGMTQWQFFFGGGVFGPLLNEVAMLWMAMLPPVDEAAECRPR